MQEFFLNEETTKRMVRGKKHGKSSLQSHNAFIAFSVRPHFQAILWGAERKQRGEKTPNNSQRTPEAGKLLAGGRARMNWLTGDSKEVVTNPENVNQFILLPTEWKVNGSVLRESSTVTKAQTFKLRYEETVKKF